MQNIREGYSLAIISAPDMTHSPNHSTHSMKHLLSLFLIGCSLISCRDHDQAKADAASTASLAKISELEEDLKIAREEIKAIQDVLKDGPQLKDEQSKLSKKLEKVEGAQDDYDSIVKQLTTQQKESQESMNRLANRQTETSDQILGLARRVLRISDAVEASEKQTRNDHGGDLSNERDAQITAIKERVARLTKRENELELALSPSRMPEAFDSGQGRALWMKKDRELKEPVIKDLQNVRELLLQENRRLNELITGSR